VVATDGRWPRSLAHVNLVPWSCPALYCAERFSPATATCTVRRWPSRLWVTPGRCTVIHRLAHAEIDDEVADTPMPGPLGIGLAAALSEAGAALSGGVVRSGCPDGGTAGDNGGGCSPDANGFRGQTASPPRPMLCVSEACAAWSGLALTVAALHVAALSPIARPEDSRNRSAMHTRTRISISSTTQNIRHIGGKAKALLPRMIATAGVRQSESRISADSQQYWNETSEARWASNSHWQSARVFAGSNLWSEIGRRHLAMFERGARMVEFGRPWGRVLEWGCGGGANAVHFAPRAREFIGVEVSADSLSECARQVGAVCDTPFTPVLIDVAEPEEALEKVGAPCDIFLCFYVFELLPTPEYGERILRIARQLLGPGGLALIQIKYDVGRWWTKPRRRAYESGLAEMTTYPIHTFWELVQKSGLTPQSIELVPKNELDERYAYFLLSRDADPTDEV
jgi:SAM-dependent methyltransferase